jgi:hypothetical protein
MAEPLCGGFSDNARKSEKEYFILELVQYVLYFCILPYILYPHNKI